MNLAELQTAVREQLDLDVADLSNTLLTQYLNEAVQQTAALESKWPFLARIWAAPADLSSGALVLPDEAGAIASVVDGDGTQLQYVGHEFAEANFTGETGTPILYSVWGNDVYLWPKPTEVSTFSVRGWKLPAMLSAAGDVPDLDSRLHFPLVHYACSRAYAQQEDEVLAQFYLQTWSAATDTVRKLVMRPRFQGQWSPGGQPVSLRRWWPNYRLVT